MFKALILSFFLVFSTARMPACDSNEIILTCTQPLTHIKICVPDFCKLDNASETLDNAETTFNCSMDFLPGNCVTYIPLPGIKEVVDTIFVYGSDVFGKLDTVVVHVGVYEDCDTSNAGEEPENSEDIVNIEEHDKSNTSLKIYPNPVINYLHIESLENNVDTFYEITNTAGQKILEGRLKTDKLEVNELKTGIYFLKIQTNKNSSTIKFIKT